MPPLPSRKSLESMKRVDLQRICKDYGVKANLKSEALIDLLLGTQSTPVPQPTRRSVSTRRSSSKAGPSRISSMIVHDITEEEQDEDREVPSEESKEQTPPQPLEAPPPRTRKAKELQTRLGVGKPLAAGGQGPRNITRSSISLKGKRAKSSRSIRLKEATIDEEPEAPSAPPKAQTDEERDQQPPTQDTSSSNHQRNSPIPAPDTSETSNLKKMIEDAIRPLEEEIRRLKLEVTQAETIKAELAILQSQVVEIQKAQQTMKAEFTSLQETASTTVALKEELDLLRESLLSSHSSPRPSTPKGRSGPPSHPPVGFGMPSVLNDIYPGATETILGKRHRTATPSVVIDAVDTGQEGEGSEDRLTRTVLGPLKKKPRMQRDEDSRDFGLRRSSSRQPSSDLQDLQDRDHGTLGSNEDVHNFTVYRGVDEPSDYIDPPPPTNRLPDFFEPDSPPMSTSTLPRPKSTTGIPTSSANAAENQPQPFGFGFLPTSSTPQNPMYMPSFPYPEPPQSPSPAGPSIGNFMGRQDERTDIFKSFGLPSPIRSSRHYGSLTEDRGVNPAALTQGSSGKQKETVNTHHGPIASSSDWVDPPPSKATMYGTELDGDTRFGDFGLEGMATGYWANKKNGI